MPPSCVENICSARACAGRGLTQDYSRAHKLLDQAIRQGAVDAYNALGVLHKDGLGKLSDTISDHSYVVMSLVHKCHVGTEPCDELAQHYFQLGADQHEPFAMVSLGAMLINSPDEQEQAQGVKLLFGAADEGSASAMYYLSQCYRYGRGIEQDLEHADGLLEEAAGKGHELAKLECVEMAQSQN